MASLIVNLDPVTGLRSLAQVQDPDPAHAAVIAELGGSGGVVVRLRRDRKRLRERDLYLLKEIIRTRLLVEIAPYDEAIDLVLKVKPSIVILTADQAGQDTRVSPIQFTNVSIDFSDIVLRLDGNGIAATFMIDPEPDAVRGASKAGARSVMIDCSGFTGAQSNTTAQQELDKIDRAASSAKKNGMQVISGRGINYRNISPLAELNLVDDFIVGHAVCARAMLIGFERAVREMIDLIRSNSSPDMS